MLTSLKYIWATLRLVAQSDLPRTKVLAAKFSRVLKLNVLRPWFFTRLDRAAWELLRGNAGGHLKIAVTRGGTLGDKIGLLLFLRGVRARFPDAKILFFDWDINAKYLPMFRDQPLIDGMFLSSVVIVNDLVRLALARGYVDLFFDNRYAVKVMAGQNSRAPAEYLREAERAFRPYDVNFLDLPFRNDLLGERFPEQSGFDMMRATALVPVEEETFRLPLVATDEGPRRSLGDERYAIIHHGAGPSIHGHVARQTKMWYAARWAEVVAELRRRGLAVYQLGVAHEELIPGADGRFLGHTTFHESSALLRDAAFLIDTEGGLVHMANLVGTRAVVLYGPTPAKFFGYARNVNVARGDCHNCWWSHDEWQTVCKKTLDAPACMDAITVKDVLAAVDELGVAP